MKTELEKYKAKITDVHCYQRDLHKKVLVSLIGDSTPEALERVVKISMEEALPKVEEDHKKYLSERNLSASLVWPHQIENSDGVIFSKIGTYQDNKTASKVFQNLAIKYSAMDLESQIEETNDKLRLFADKFKDF
jgi:hypothetical protein